jgi:ferric-dicitrate binding protein FerR (iron transport regulator)
MGCHFRAQLEDVAAGRAMAAAAQAFDAHLPTCEGCREELARTRSVRALLSAYTPVEPTDLDWTRLDRKVLAALSGAKARPAAWLLELLPSLTVGSLAAAVLLVWLARSPPRKPLEISVAMRPGTGALAVGLGPDSLAQAPGAAPALLEASPLVSAGSKLYSGAGSISLQTAAATGIHLARESQAVLERLAEGDTALRLLDGLMLAEVKPLAPSQRFEVRAGDLVVRVHGTSFAVERREGLTLVSVVRGLVEVGRDGAGSKLLTGPGTLAIPDGAPLPEPVDLDTRISARFPLSFADAAVESVFARGKLARLHSRPEGAEVWVGGAFRGATPVAVLLPPGRQAVRLVAPDRPDLILDLDAGIRALELAALPPPVEIEPLGADRSAFRAEGTLTPAPRRATPKAALASRQFQAREAMNAEARAHKDDLVRCYERAMKRNPALEGQLTLTVALDKAGNVRGVSARELQVDQRFLDCAAGSIRTWDLPGTGEEERVDIPVHLSPRNWGN